MSGEEIAGRYRLIEPLGRGAMSSVWLAQDSELERRVAVKLLSPAADRARFEREARAAASLSHPNLCSLYDYGESAGKPFMVLEYLPNGSLEERLQDGNPLPDADTHRIAAEMAAGLAHAHGRGLVHRDLKPSNILFDSEGRAKIADFGIAHMGDAGALTEAGTVLGTASYISPEQASGTPAGPASDVYSFGVILFRMLTGRLPFIAQNAMEVVRMQRDEAPPTVAEFRSGAPARLESLTAAALAKDPARRPADGAALLRELRGIDEDATMVIAPGAIGAAAGAAATQVVRPARSGQRRRFVIVLALFAALALLGIGVAVALVSTDGGASEPVATSLPGLDLPTVTTVASSSAATTTAPTTTAATTTAPTTAAATTTAPATTAAATTAPTTTAAATLPTVPTVTTAPTTTVVPPPPPTTTVVVTTSPATTATTTTTPGP
jgi:serine/threonine-protein kinase